MPTPEESRERARNERLQAHLDSVKLSDNDTVVTRRYTVYNVSRGTRYEVTVGYYVTGSGNVWYHCTCPFMTKGSRLSSGVCKHIQRVKDKLNGCDVCSGNRYVKVVGTKRLCASCRWHDRFMQRRL